MSRRADSRAVGSAEPSSQELGGTPPSPFTLGASVASPPPDPSNPTLAWLLLARILRPQGRKGEVLADLFTDFPERFRPAGGLPPRVFLAKPGFSGPASAARPADVVSFFLTVGKNQGRIVLHFAGTDSISAAETLAGLEVIVPHEERLTPGEDAAYIDDLVGCTVYNTPVAAQPATQPGSNGSITQTPRTDIPKAELVGIVEDVQFPTTPDGARRLEDAAPLLIVLSPTGKELLVPYVKTFLISTDLTQKRLVMALPEGLLDLNP